MQPNGVVRLYPCVPRPDLKIVSAEPNLSELSDDDLMLLAKRHRRDAFEILVSRHTSLVLGTAVRFLGDRGRGREVAQDVFLMLWSERDRYRPQNKLKGLLVTMTFNRCRSVARQNKSDRSRLERLERLDANDDPHSPLDVLLEKSRTAAVRHELTKLPEPMRQILILRYTQDMSLGEIADLTDKPLGTIKSHVFRGLRKLREVFREGEPL